MVLFNGMKAQIMPISPDSYAKIIGGKYLAVVQICKMGALDKIVSVLDI